MRRETDIERRAYQDELHRQAIWQRWQNGEIKPHPSIGIVCPWCGADFCEIDNHVQVVHGR